MEIFKRRGVVGAVLTIIGIVISLIISPDVRSYVSSLFDVIYSKLISHPFFSGVMFSWGFAVLSTAIVLFFAYKGKKGKKDEYEGVFRQSERWLREITVVILFYIAIHLASKAFFGSIGVPIFGESYAEILVGGQQDKLYFLQYISPQDIFLSSLAFWIIILIFLVAPYTRSFLDNTLSILPIPNVSARDEGWCFSWDRSRRIGTVSVFFVLSIVFSFIAALVVYYRPFLFSFLSHLIKPSSNGELSDDAPLLFFITFLISFIILFALPLVKPEIRKAIKGIKNDFRDLLLFFCFTPAIMVASLVIAGDDLVKFPNFFGHVVVGVLLISGFFTLVTLTTISFSFNGKPYYLWLCLTFASLMAISGFSGLFLSLALSQDVLEVFGNILSFAVAIMIIVLLYGFFYEKLRKYQFTEWWRREWRPIAMIFSIVMITIVGAFNPVDKLWVTPIPMKLLLIIAVVVIGFGLPWIIMWFRMLLKGQKPKLRMKLPMHQGMVLVEANPGSLKNVVKELDDIDGVYQTMVVKGEYDVCLTVEGVSSDDIEEKILKIRKINGIAGTTTLTDMREFFDREVI